MKIEIKAVGKSYSLAGQHVRKVLENVSFSFEETGLYFIIGKSGSGKSTLLNIISGLESPTEGTVEYDGVDVTDRSETKVVNCYRNMIGFVFQDDNLFYEISVVDNLNFFQKDPSVSESILRRLNLWDVRTTKVKFLSGGEQARLAVACSLVRNSEVLILDEPTGSLDEKNRLIIYELLRELCRERLIIVATHDEKSACKFADALIGLKDGQIKLNTLKTIPQTKPKKTTGEWRLNHSILWKYIMKNAAVMKTKALFLLLIAFFAAVGIGLTSTIVFPNYKGTVEKILQRSPDLDFFRLVNSDYTDSGVLNDQLKNVSSTLYWRSLEIEKENSSLDLIIVDRPFDYKKMQISDLPFGEIWITDTVAKKFNLSAGEDFVIDYPLLNYRIGKIIPTGVEAEENGSAHSYFKVFVSAATYRFAPRTDLAQVRFSSGSESLHLTAVNAGLLPVDNLLSGRWPKRPDEVAVPLNSLTSDGRGGYFLNTVSPDDPKTILDNFNESGQLDLCGQLVGLAIDSAVSLTNLKVVGVTESESLMVFLAPDQLTLFSGEYESNFGFETDRKGLKKMSRFLLKSEITPMAGLNYETQGEFSFSKDFLVAKRVFVEYKTLGIATMVIMGVLLFLAVVIYTSFKIDGTSLLKLRTKGLKPQSTFLIAGISVSLVPIIGIMLAIPVIYRFEPFLSSYLIQKDELKYFSVISAGYGEVCTLMIVAVIIFLIATVLTSIRFGRKELGIYRKKHSI